MGKGFYPPIPLLPTPLASPDLSILGYMLSTLTVDCRLEDESARERLIVDAEAKKT